MSRVPVTEIKMGVVAFHLQRTRFLDGELTSVMAGFPQYFNVTTCLKCLSQSQDLTMLGGCTLNKVQPIGAGSVSIGLRMSGGSFGLVADSLRQYVEVGPNITDIADASTPVIAIQGHGDVTASCDIFLVHTTPFGNLHFYEYHNRAHCTRERIRLYNTLLSNSSFPSSSERFWFRAEAPVNVTAISCSTNRLTRSQSFESALQVYRSVQIEDRFSTAMTSDESQWHDDSTHYDRYLRQQNSRTKTINQSSSNEKDSNTEVTAVGTEASVSQWELTADDVYKAALSRILLESDPTPGQYYEYRECGTYNFTFMVPLMIASFLLVLLGLFAIALKTLGYGSAHDINVPSTSDMWFQEMLRAKFGGSYVGVKEDRFKRRSFLSRLRPTSHDVVLEKQGDDFKLRVCVNQ